MDITRKRLKTFYTSRFDFFFGKKCLFGYGKQPLGMQECRCLSFFSLGLELALSVGIARIIGGWCRVCASVEDLHE